MRTDQASLGTGEQVRIELTDRGTADLAPLIGPGAVAMEGRLVEGADDHFGLAISMVELRNGVENYWRGERVAIPRDAVARIERRRFSRSRTAFAAGLTLVASFAAMQVWGAISDSPTGGGPGDGSGSPQ